MISLGSGSRQSRDLPVDSKKLFIRRPFNKKNKLKSGCRKNTGCPEFRSLHYFFTIFTFFFRIKSNPASLQTRASSKSSKSSKNRRKHEKKKYSTKEGSAFEDIALVASLHELITKAYSMTGNKQNQLQWGSEIRPSLDFEWSKRGWVTNGLDVE